jgi:secondary thiamine-phosphate synthase enzyme
MRQNSVILPIKTKRQGLLDITGEVTRWVHAQSMQQGLLTVFCRHTSASLLVQENASAAAAADIETYFTRLAPENPAAYTHNDEGADDMPAHLRTALTQVQLSIPLAGGQLALGTWQAIYLFEHRRDPHTRTLALHLLGE